jgi:hypothetical protein
MQTRRMSSAALFVSLLIFSAPLFAHHGNAAFDEKKKVTVKGTVTEWIWANPHCFLRFDAKDEKGNVVHWSMETSNPPDMINRGWSRDTFKPGDEIIATMITVKNGQPIGSLRGAGTQVAFANGKVVGTPQ